MNNTSTQQHNLWCKICGVTRPSDALAIAAHADAIGINCFPSSARYVAPAVAQEICAEVSCTRVALFVDPEPQAVEAVLHTAAVDMLQFHGDETPEFCRGFGLPYLKAVRMRPGVNVTALADAHEAAWGLLLDAYVPSQHGGTGQTFDWSLWPEDLHERRLIIAGGLDPDNVAAAVESVQPFGVDVAGGVEDSTKGVKSYAKSKAFIERARAAAGRKPL